MDVHCDFVYCAMPSVLLAGSSSTLCVKQYVEPAATKNYHRRTTWDHQYHCYRLSTHITTWTCSSKNQLGYHAMCPICSIMPFIRFQWLLCGQEVSICNCGCTIDVHVWNLKWSFVFIFEYVICRFGRHYLRQVLYRVVCFPLHSKRQRQRVLLHVTCSISKF